MKNYQKKIILVLAVFVMCFSNCYSQNNENHKPSVLILIPFDLNANGGFSPETQEILEKKVINHSDINLIKFPLIKLMNVSYQNIYDKKYCKPILEKINVDFIIMTKLDLENELAYPKKWSLNFRIYNVKNNTQLNSKLKGKNLTLKEIEKMVSSDYGILINEIKNYR